MAAGPKLVADRTEHGTEARRVPQALESLQLMLTLAHGLVRVLDSIVLAPAAEMGDARHDDRLGRGLFTVENIDAPQSKEPGQMPSLGCAT